MELLNFGEQLFIGRLEPHSVEELVDGSMKQLHIDLFDKAEIMRGIYEFTSGHPNIAQLLCHRLILRLNTKRSLRLSPEDIRDVVNDPEFLKDDFLKIYWQRATILERLSSLVMVADEHARTQERVYEALARYGIQAPGINEVYKALERLVVLRNILSRTGGAAYYGFAVSAFPRIITLTGELENYLTRDREIYLKFGDIVPSGDD